MKKLSLVLATVLAVATMFLATSCQPISATIADTDSATNYYKSEGTAELVTPQTGVSFKIGTATKVDFYKNKNSNYVSYTLTVPVTNVMGTREYSYTSTISFIKIDGKYYENYGTKDEKDITSNIEGDVATGNFKLKDYVYGTGVSAIKVNITFTKK